MRTSIHWRQACIETKLSVACMWHIETMPIIVGFFHHQYIHYSTDPTEMLKQSCLS